MNRLPSGVKGGKKKKKAERAERGIGGEKETEGASLPLSIFVSALTPLGSLLTGQASFFRGWESGNELIFDELEGDLTTVNTVDKTKYSFRQYPASRGFFLASLLACTKSFASLVFRAVGLLTCQKETSASRVFRQ